jgi:hypothetical protein
MIADMFSDESNKDALTTAFITCIMAPTEDEVDILLEAIEELAMQMTPEDVAECKQRAIAWIDQQERNKQTTIH